MVSLGLVLLVVGGFAVVVFQIQLMILAFKTSTAWGWVYLVVPVGSIVYVARHWGACKKPFLRLLGAIGIVAAGVALFIPHVLAHPEDKVAECASQDDEISMSACTSLIQSGRETTAVLAAAHNNRGVDYNNARLYDQAIADLTKAIALQADFPEAYSNRGISYHEKGFHDRAMADYDKAIALKPDFAQAYDNRGNAYFKQDRHEQAIADYSKAIALEPGFVRASWGRGLAYFYTAQYEKAQVDLGRIARDKNDPYAAIWLCMTSQRLGADGRRLLAERAAGFSRTAWPAPIVQLFLGRTTPAEVIAAAGDDDPKEASRKGCEAAFYVGEHRLATSDRAARLALFEAAERACKKDDPAMVEALATQVELKRLRAAAGDRR